MKVMVTGGTGFLGSHTVEALVRAGHQIRLLARSPAKVDRVLKQRGIEVSEVVIGDMTDPATVEEALAGCDAAVHTAIAMYGGEDVYEANIAGAYNVLGRARDLGLAPIIYTSSIAAMYPPPGDVIGPDDPIVSLETTYGRSKAEGERYARDLQLEGVPVVTIYPAGIYGPNDPGPGETMKGLRDAIKKVWPITTSGVSVVDVRDLAEIIATALASVREPRRYMAAGHYIGWKDKADLCDRLTGRACRRVHAPPFVLRAVAQVLDLARKVRPIEYPLTREAVDMMTRFVPCDSSRTVEELGISFRPLEETLTDSIRWLVDAGELPAEFAPGLADDLSALP